MRLMKTCIVMSAIPGSGKSTWARRYKEAHKNTYIVSSDDLREELYGSAKNFDHEAELWETFLRRLNEPSTYKEDDVTVIADATNLQNKYRILYNKSTPLYDRHILVMFDIPFEECLKQNKQRSIERIVPDYAMEMLKNEYEPINDEVMKIYDEIFVIKKYGKFKD